MFYSIYFTQYYLSVASKRDYSTRYIKQRFICVKFILTCYIKQFPLLQQIYIYFFLGLDLEPSSENQEQNQLKFTHLVIDNGAK